MQTMQENNNNNNNNNDNNNNQPIRYLKVREKFDLSPSSWDPTLASDISIF